MELLVKFFRLKNRQKILFMETLLLLTMLRILLQFLPYKQVSDLINKLNFKSNNEIPLAVVRQAILSVSKHVSFARNCFIKAIAGNILLKKYGHSTTMHIGAFKEEDKLKAHAWLEINGKVILGRTEDLNSYVPFLEKAAI